VRCKWYFVNPSSIDESPTALIVGCSLCFDHAFVLPPAVLWHKCLVVLGVPTSCRWVELSDMQPISVRMSGGRIQCDCVLLAGGAVTSYTVCHPPACGDDCLVSLV
jgi:hypothetical protein